MDKFTIDHLMNFISRNVRENDKWEFAGFAANILSDEHDLNFYMREGWQKLLDRFYRER